MKRIQLFTLTFLFALLTFTACTRLPVPEDKKDYVGTWKSNEVTLTLTQDGGVNYERIGPVNKTFKGPLKAFKGNDFVAGIWFLTTTFKVDSPPHLDGNLWKMTVDGIELIRTYPLVFPSLPPLPLPLDEESSRLAIETFRDFAWAVKNKNFEPFYQKTSQLWKTNMTAAGIAKAFQVFMDKQIDLTNNQSMPVFSEKPAINSENRLLLKGYFPQSGPMPYFEFYYTYEHPHWALTSISVSIK